LTVQKGDLSLTPLGRAWAEASILACKEMIAGRILRLPVMAWIYETLRHQDDGRMERDYFHDKLRAELGDAPEVQRDTAINWGRQAGLFVHNDAAGILFLGKWRDARSDIRPFNRIQRRSRGRWTMPEYFQYFEDWAPFPNAGSGPAGLVAKITRRLHHELPAGAWFTGRQPTRQF
jgi:C-terminal AAA-associated domain